MTAKGLWAEFAKRFQAPLLFRCGRPAAENVEIAILRPDFEERIIGTNPLLDDLIDQVVALAELKTDRPLVRFPARIAFHPQFHLLPLSLCERLLKEL